MENRKLAYSHTLNLFYMQRLKKSALLSFCFMLYCLSGSCQKQLSKEPQNSKYSKVEAVVQSDGSVIYQRTGTLHSSAVAEKEGLNSGNPLLNSSLKNDSGSESLQFDAAILRNKKVGNVSEEVLRNDIKEIEEKIYLNQSAPESIARLESLLERKKLQIALLEGN